MLTDKIGTKVYQSWNEIPLQTEEEIAGESAPVVFYASTTLNEKMQRIFNNAMFFIAGVKLVALSPLGRLGNLAFTVVSGSSFAQFSSAAIISPLAIKIIVTLAFIVAIRKIAAGMINYLVYPAALGSLNSENIDHLRRNNFLEISNLQYEFRRVALNKSGINYDSFIIENAETKGNGKWVVIAGGNGWIGDEAILYCVEAFKKYKVNIMYVNGPGVGRSTGFPTTYAMGAGQEAGLQFLEKVIKCDKTLIYGTSLGGGAQGEGILSHQFLKESKHYLVWSDRSFDLLSNAASAMVTSLAKPLFLLLGIELSGLAGAKKLANLGIRHIVTQNHNILNAPGEKLPMAGTIDETGTDGVIPNKASLYVGLRKAGFINEQRLKCFGNSLVHHIGPLEESLREAVDKEVFAFFA